MVRPFECVISSINNVFLRTGDLYSAARDYLYIIQQWPDYTEAYFCLIRCLLALKWPQEAAEWLEYFCKAYPDYENHEEVVKLKKVLDMLQSNGSKKEENTERVENVLSNIEQQLRLEARDYEVRFVGHCNTTTDIKEANFLGKLFDEFRIFFISCL